VRRASDLHVLIQFKRSEFKPAGCNFTIYDADLYNVEGLGSQIRPPVIHCSFLQLPRYILLLSTTTTTTWCHHVEAYIFWHDVLMSTIGFLNQYPGSRLIGLIKLNYYSIKIQSFSNQILLLSRTIRPFHGSVSNIRTDRHPDTQSL